MSKKLINLEKLSLEELNPKSPPDCCCLCLGNNATFPELRPSGDSLDIQIWYYCQECWEYMCMLREIVPILGEGFLDAEGANTET